MGNHVFANRQSRSETWGYNCNTLVIGRTTDTMAHADSMQTLMDKVKELREDADTVREEIDGAIVKLEASMAIVEAAALKWGYAITTLKELEDLVEELKVSLKAETS